MVRWRGGQGGRGFACAGLAACYRKAMTMLAIILLSQTAPAQLLDAAPPASMVLKDEPNDPRGPMPLSNPAYWVTTMDYPVASLRTGEQGTTGFTVRVDKEGRVTSCWVRSSSGSPSLDEATCSLVTRRSRFRPAFDTESRPKEGEYSNRVRWVIPVGSPPEPGLVTISYTVSEAGEVINCKVTMEGAAASQAGRMANVCVNGRKMKPYTDTNGQPAARMVSITTRITVE